MDKFTKNQVPLLKEVRRQSFSLPTSPELSGRRQSLTVLQLGEDATWKEAADRQFKSPIKLPIKVPPSRVAAVLEMSKKPLFNFRFSVGFLFLFIVIMIASSSFYHQRDQMLFALNHRIKLLPETRQFLILGSNKSVVARVNYGVNLPADVSVLKCDTHRKGNRSLCLHWNFRANLTIDHRQHQNNVSCHHVQWKAHSSQEILKDCINLSDAFWFGMGQTDLPKPLNGLNLKSTPFVSSHHFNAGLNRRVNTSSPFGSIIKRYWISSKGVTIQVPLSVPLWISFNSTESGKPDEKLCFEAQTNQFPFKLDRPSPAHLEYTICTGPNALKTHAKIAEKWVSWKTSSNGTLPSPGAFFLDKPIWLIDSKIMSELERLKIESYINRTIDFGPLPGLLLLDTKWQRNLGDLQIEEKKFSDLKKVLIGVKRRGFKIMVTADPLIDSSSPLFDKAIKEERVFIDNRLMTPLITSCDGDIMLGNNSIANQKRSFCSVIDFYNKTTREWFANRLANLSNYSINGLMFKSIQVSRMPRYSLNPSTSGFNPDNYQLYVKQIVESHFDLVGMDTFTGSEGVSGFVKISPLESSWKSLRSLIPTVLSLGVIGYPLVNTGSVGGDIIVGKDQPSLVDQSELSVSNSSEFTQLYIRWMQLATFLPILQLSDVPDESLRKLVHHFLHVREKQVIPLMKSSMAEYLSNGLPIVRPVWMLDPDVKETYLINNQFAIGKKMIVAPILSFNSSSRDIYLPIGWWKDEISGSTVRGGKWMRNYQLELSRIAFFTRINPEVSL